MLWLGGKGQDFSKRYGPKYGPNDTIGEHTMCIVFITLLLSELGNSRFCMLMM
jgi:hypothetical protein